MPRPKKCRRVCALPNAVSFVPDPQADDLPPIVMAVEEYEAIRLIDYLGCTQEEAAARMAVARTTVQAIYDRARWKMAAVLVERRRLEIRGGEYRLCPRASGHCSHSSAGGSCCGSSEENRQVISQMQERRNQTMKVAVTYENGLVFAHFGHTAQFKLYEIEDGKILSSTVVPTGGSGHGALAGFLAAQGVSALICGGIGGGARTALAQAGIALYPGVSGSADAAAQALAEGRLVYNPQAQCADHAEGHGHEDCGHHDHACGEGHQGCGGHHGSCGEDHQGCAGRG